MTTAKKNYYNKNYPPQKIWLANNFRFNIDGMTTATARTNKIEAITIKHTGNGELGEARNLASVAGRMELSNLVFTLPEAWSQPVLAWHNSFVVLGQNDDSQEKNGSLEFLSPNRKTVLFRLDFKNLGIFRVTPAKGEANADTIKRTKVELYCERIEMQYQPGSGGTAPKK